MSILPAKRFLNEMTELEALIEDFGDMAQSRIVNHVEFRGVKYPLYCITLGSQKKEDPAIGFFGGVHGLEKIGSEVVMSYMQTLQLLMEWDECFRDRLKRSRIVFMPLVNPVGIKMRRRSNGNGVDLMRNAPVDADRGNQGFFIYRGHRVSPWLPWYRGVEDESMEVESQALCQVVREELFPSKLSVAIDVHSGFGARDRFWFPYACSRKPFEFLPEVYALKGLFDRSYPHHFYVIEPVSRQYTINGDLWDYLSFEYSQKKDQRGRCFIPWTLEMGSWMWLRKNPLQIFSRHGMFHPIKPHRHQRILRRHLTLFDFLHRAILSPDVWINASSAKKLESERKALEEWYEPRFRKNA